MDEPFVPMTVPCPHCKEEQSVDFAEAPKGGYYDGLNPQTITCIAPACGKDFNVIGPGKILAGPFPIPPGFENLQ